MKGRISTFFARWFASYALERVWSEDIARRDARIAMLEDCLLAATGTAYPGNIVTRDMAGSEARTIVYIRDKRQEQNERMFKGGFNPKKGK